MRKVIFICDHSLDPRLRRRVQWFEKNGFIVDIFVDKSRGQHFKSSSINENDIADLKLKMFDKDTLLYVSGARIIISKFFLILFLGRILERKRIFYEIPDLPLRSHNSLVNAIYSKVFSILVGALFKKIIITSPAFVKALPKFLDFHLCENLPSKETITCSEESEKTVSKVKMNPLTIGFVGALRYESQMFLLIKYCINFNIKCIFFGGPVEKISSLINLCKKNNLQIDSNIEFRGGFDTAELAKIYMEIDFVYSVYDSLQPNVKLALPNKLYESVLFNTPIVVAESTYLSELVEKYNIGFKVNAIDYKEFEKNMTSGLMRKYDLTSKREDVIKKINNCQQEFMEWVSNSLHT